MSVRRRRVSRAARRRAKRETENALARARGQESATAAEEDEFRPRVGRHVAQIDHLLTEGAITTDMTRAGHRFAHDYERSMTMVGRLVGRYEADDHQAAGEVVRTP